MELTYNLLALLVYLAFALFFAGILCANKYISTGRATSWECLDEGRHYLVMCFIGKYVIVQPVVADTDTGLYVKSAREPLFIIVPYQVIDMIRKSDILERIDHSLAIYRPKDINGHESGKEINIII